MTPVLILIVILIIIVIVILLIRRKRNCRLRGEEDFGGSQPKKLVIDKPGENPEVVSLKELADKLNKDVEEQAKEHMEASGMNPETVSDVTVKVQEKEGEREREREEREGEREGEREERNDNIPLVILENGGHHDIFSLSRVQFSSDLGVTVEEFNALVERQKQKMKPQKVAPPRNINFNLDKYKAVRNATRDAARPTLKLRDRNEDVISRQIYRGFDM
jgi:hypothetical protein